jgi:prepilin-type N-terminal cleavage/methylation domain-containing protein
MKPIIQKGFTLIEIILLIVIMGIMFTVAMKSMQPSIERARETATLEEMDLVAEAIIGNDNLIEDGIRSDYGYVGDIGSLPSTLDDLITRPAGYLTWNGPYLSAGFSITKMMPGISHTSIREA